MGKKRQRERERGMGNFPPETEMRGEWMTGGLNGLAGGLDRWLADWRTIPSHPIHRKGSAMIYTRRSERAVGMMEGGRPKVANIVVTGGVSWPRKPRRRGPRKEQFSTVSLHTHLGPAAADRADDRQTE